MPTPTIASQKQLVENHIAIVQRHVTNEDAKADLVKPIGTLIAGFIEQGVLSLIVDYMHRKGCTPHVSQLLSEMCAKALWSPDQRKICALLRSIDHRRADTFEAFMLSNMEEREALSAISNHRNLFSHGRASEVRARITVLKSYLKHAETIVSKVEEALA